MAERDELATALQALHGTGPSAWHGPPLDRLARRWASRSVRAAELARTEGLSLQQARLAIAVAAYGLVASQGRVLPIAMQLDAHGSRWSLKLS